MFDAEFEADAYDVTCRICDDWGYENVSPTIAAMHLMRHSNHHDTAELGEPWWALRVVSGEKGRPQRSAHQTPEDGWNRSPTLGGETDD